MRASWCLQWGRRSYLCERAALETHTCTLVQIFAHFTCTGQRNSSHLSPRQMQGWPVSLGGDISCPRSLCPGGLHRPSMHIAVEIALSLPPGIASGLSVRACVMTAVCCSLPPKLSLHCASLRKASGATPAHGHH